MKSLPATAIVVTGSNVVVAGSTVVEAAAIAIPDRALKRFKRYIFTLGTYTIDLHVIAMRFS